MRLDTFLFAPILVVGVLGAAAFIAKAEEVGAAVKNHDCAPASAGVQLLAKITNTRDDDFHCFGLSVDAQANITAIHFETNIFDDDPSSPDRSSHKIRVREFGLSEVASARGAVLDGVPGHDAVILQGDIVDGRPIEPIVIKFLYNGVTNEFHECPGTLSRDEEGDWHLVNPRNDPVSHAIIKLRRVPIIGVIGIETLEGLCI